MLCRCLPDRYPGSVAASHLMNAIAMPAVFADASERLKEVLAELRELAQSEVAMQIADDGTGGAGPRGHSLANIADRVSALDRCLVIDSPPGRGTRLVVTVPCG